LTVARELLGLTIHGDERVYGPAEDSMLLASNVTASAEHRALEVCTGTGLAALRLARGGAATVATDVHPVACCLARRNARANDLDLAVVCTDLAAGVSARFDRIACNPPYLPAGGDHLGGPIGRALESGRRGTALTQRFLDRLPDLLAAEGRAWLVVSSRQPVDELEARAGRAGLAWHRVNEVAVGRFETLGLVELRREA
jgi:release factor glutamine methyltransferase